MSVLTALRIACATISWIGPTSAGSGLVLSVRIVVVGVRVLRHAVPVLGNLAVLDPEKVVVRAGVLVARILRIVLVAAAGHHHKVALAHDRDARKRDLRLARPDGPRLPPVRDPR